MSYTHSHLPQKKNNMNIKENIQNLINQNEIYLDYLEIVDEENFKYPNKYSKKLKLLIAAYVENVRLIDNIDIKI